MANPRYLMWYDDNPKVPLVRKVEAAVDAYTRRFAISPNVVLVNASDVVECPSVRVRSVDHIQRNNFWVGREAAEA
jgi:hypothetical protein